MQNKSGLLDGSLDYERNLPLHHQILCRIRSAIESGELAPGDALPPEEELCTALGVSRSTVRLAIGALAKEGLVARVQGKGTFVSEQKIRRRMECVYSFTHEMEALSKRPSSHVLSLEAVPQDDDLSVLKFETEDELAWRIMRIRCADDEPLLIETTHIPCHYLPELDAQSLAHASLYDMLFDRGVVPAKAEETYESVMIKTLDAVLLGIDEATTGFFIERHTTSVTGEVYELTRSIMRGDRSKLVVNLEQYSYSIGKQFKD